MYQTREVELYTPEDEPAKTATLLQDPPYDLPSNSILIRLAHAGTYIQR